MFSLFISAVSAEDLNGTEIPQEDFSNFTDLQNTIDSCENNSEITLNSSYKYDSNESLNEGVVISKNIKINGNNHIIDGSNLARCLNITNNTHVILENIIFINGFSNSSDGGAIHTDRNVNLTVKNCTFKNNLIYNHNGGAISTNESSNVEIIGCVFENNTSIRVSNLAWADFKRGMGSALYHTINSTLALTDSIFKSNNAYLSIILLVSFDDVNYALSKLYIKNCLFENNTSFRCGVVYIDEFGEGEIIDSTFIKNHSQVSTGTLILDTCPYALVKNCFFKDNYGKDGGAICVEIYKKTMTSNARIVDCRFINNFASENGGAISSVGGVVDIQNCLFEDNQANERGGAVYSRLGSLKLSNSIFNDNNAEYGGSLYLKSNDTIVTGCNFLNSKAYMKGAAVYLKEYALLKGCNYVSNSAPNDKNKYGVYNAFEISGKIQAKNLKVSYKSGKTLKITLSKPAVGVKIKIKVYTNKKYKTYYVTTDKNGVATFDASKIKAGTHKVKISSADGCFKAKTKKITLKVTKAKAKVKLTKSKVKIIFKNRPLSKIKVKIKINNKQITKKTNSKGIINLKLKKGKNNVLVTSANSNYKFSKKFKIKSS